MSLALYPSPINTILMPPFLPFFAFCKVTHSSSPYSYPYCDTLHSWVYSLSFSWNTTFPLRLPAPFAIDLMVNVTSVFLFPLEGETSHQSGLLATSHSPSALIVKVCLCSVLRAQATDGRQTNSWWAAMRLKSRHPLAVWYWAMADSGTSTVKLSLAIPSKAFSSI